MTKHIQCFSKIILDMRSRATDFLHSSGRRCKLKYNVCWMIKVFLLSNCLRTSADLGDAIQHALNMLLPPVLIPVFASVLGDTDRIRPDAGTVSRWRLLIDGAFMLWHRRANSKDGGQHVRYMMADSSTQHGRTFQLLSMQSISHAALPRMFSDVTDLIEMWCPRYVCAKRRPIRSLNRAVFRCPLIVFGRLYNRIV